MKTHYVFILAITWLLLPSCKNKYGDHILVKVTKKDYIESLSFDGTVEPVNSISVNCPQIYNVSVAYIVDEGVMVKQGDTICILENQELINEYNNQIKGLKSQRAEYTKLKANLGLKVTLLEADIKNNEIQTDIINLDSLQLEYSSELQKRITELEIKKAHITREKLKKKLASLERINNAELHKMELQIKRYETNIEQTRENIDLLYIKAPQDGMSTICWSWSVGGKIKVGHNVYDGQPLIQLPDMSSAKVVLRVAESEFKRLEMKQPVEISFDALPGIVAAGEISLLTPIGKPIERDSKIKVFDVEILVKDTIDLPEQGTTAQCRVILNKQKDALIIPQVAIEITDSLKYVYIESNEGIVKQQIATSFESNKEAVVSQGLSENDVIFLSKIKPSEIKQTHHIELITDNNTLKNDTTQIVEKNM